MVDLGMGQRESTKPHDVVGSAEGGLHMTEREVLTGRPSMLSFNICL